MPFQTVRRVLPHEYPKYRTHLKALDPESRTLRFANPVSDAVIDQFCDKIEADPSKHILFAIEDADLSFVAIGHIAVEGEMELAFSVLKEYQGQGMGSALMKRAVQWCRTNNILKGCMVCLSTNSAIRHLCRKYGILVESEHGESLADIELDSPGLDTFVSEVTDTNLGMLDFIGKRFIKPWANIV